MTSYTYLGDYSATPAWHSRYMTCEPCRVSWHGCWDNFTCPKCGEGELPSSDWNELQWFLSHPLQQPPLSEG